jgi:hypothetical protein
MRKKPPAKRPAAAKQPKKKPAADTSPTPYHLVERVKDHGFGLTETEYEIQGGPTAPPAPKKATLAAPGKVEAIDAYPDAYPDADPTKAVFPALSLEWPAGINEEITRVLLEHAKATENSPGGWDTLEVNLEGPINVTTEKPDGTQLITAWKELQLKLPVTYHATLGGLAFELNGTLFQIDLPDAPDRTRTQTGLRERNVRFQIPPPAGAVTEPPVLTATDYYFHTGQEIDVLERAACDGKSGQHYRNETQRGARIYEPKDATHRVELMQDQDGSHETLSLESLEKLTRAQDADFNFTLLYVASTLAPPSPMPSNAYAGGWIDLDDVMKKIGWNPAKLALKDRNEKRARVWDYLCYGNRATVIGKRSGKAYRDPTTREEIPTEIHSPVWRIMSVESPVQRALFGEVPRRVEIVISKQWEPLLTSAKLAQYLPMAELLGAIPPNKVAGDWARIIALTLARLWRTKPRETLAGTLRPTRRELLTRYTPKTTTVEELLSGPNPKRALKYYREAISRLAEVNFIESEGEAKCTVADWLKLYKGQYGWQDAWLDGRADIWPGPKMRLPVQERAEALPPLKPKALKAPRKRPSRPNTKP